MLVVSPKAAGLASARASGAIKLAGIAKSFGETRVLRGIDLDIRAGEFITILGPSGCGKSTLLRIIAGLERQSGGTVGIDGRSVDALPPDRRDIAMVFQSYALYPHLTVAENIALRLEPATATRRIDWKSRRERAAQLLSRIGAAISPDAEVRSLSMPEQQLVEIACAVGTGASIVIMDEPTASLTQKEQHLLHAVVRDLRRDGVGVIYISHRLEEIFALADRVVLLDEGRAVATGTHEELLATSERYREVLARIEHDAEVEAGSDAEGSPA